MKRSATTANMMATTTPAHKQGHYAALSLSKHLHLCTHINVLSHSTPQRLCVGMKAVRAACRAIRAECSQKPRTVRMGTTVWNRAPASLRIVGLMVTKRIARAEKAMRIARSK